MSVCLLYHAADVSHLFFFWIFRKNIYVTGTLRRPVPLEHHLCYNNNFYKVSRISSLRGLEMLSCAVLGLRSHNLLFPGSCHHFGCACSLQRLFLHVLVVRVYTCFDAMLAAAALVVGGSSAVQALPCFWLSPSAKGC